MISTLAGPRLGSVKPKNIKGVNNLEEKVKNKHTQNRTTMTDLRRIVIIDYTNWKGERRERRITPLSVQFENSEWHPETQWILEAVDEERGVIRDRKSVV